MTLEAYPFPVLLAGNVSLDFCNTVEYRESERCIDVLQSYGHVIGWCENAGIIDAVERKRLDAIAHQHPAQAATAYRAALDLRETLYRLFTAVIAEEEPSSSEIAHLNDALSMGRRGIQRAGDGFTWSWEKSDDLMQVLTPIALVAAELLTSDQLQWVRQCSNCGWLFVDTSRNHSRRWCSMDFCGSKIKSRRQYERRKNAQSI